MMLTALDSALAITVVLALYVCHIRTTAPLGAISDEWALGIVVGHGSAEPKSDPLDRSAAPSNTWVPRLNVHVSREAVWPSEAPSVGVFSVPLLVEHGHDGGHALDVLFDNPQNQFTRVRAHSGA